MQSHKYSVGARVKLVGRTHGGGPSGEYEVVRQLPLEAGQLLYRVKSVLEMHERVVGEEHMTARSWSE